jgi:hypothetical protein
MNWTMKNTIRLGILSYNQHSRVYVLVQPPFPNRSFQASTVFQLCPASPKMVSVFYIRWLQFVHTLEVVGGISTVRDTFIEDTVVIVSETSNSFTQVLFCDTILQPHLKTKVTTNTEYQETLSGTDES